MARLVSALISSLCVLGLGALANGPENNFVNVNITKTFDLSNPVARMRLTIVAKSADSTSRSKYYIALPESEAK